MFYFNGNINGTALSDQLNLSVAILKFTLTNKNAGQVTVNVYLKTDAEELSIIPYNLILDEGDMWIENEPIVVKDQSQIKVVSDASLDYLFTLDNLPPV